VVGRAELALITVTVWDELKPVLLELRDAGALTAYPDPRVDEGRHPPFSIDLAAWASEHADDLHERFGDDVTLQVGALRYPDPQPYLIRESFATVPELDNSEAVVTLATPIEVQSGHSLHTRLHIRGCGSAMLKISTNGLITATIIDPKSAQVVGGFAGPQTMPLVIFTVSPGEELDIPLLVGTQSFVPELGYGIPAGEWHMAAILRVKDHPEARTPYLPLTVV
jgi:hypothetical protein